MTLKKHLGLAVKLIIAIPLSIFFAFPFIWMFMGIFKTNQEIWQRPHELLPETLRLIQVIENIQNISFTRYIFNSVFIGIMTTLAMLIVATLFTYALVFLDFKFKDALFALILLTYMLPGAVTYVPSYVILARMGLLDSFTGLILSNTASVFAVFYLRQSFLKMNPSYYHAALVDGASAIQVLRHVIIPLNGPAFMTLSVLTFVQQYNNYMWPSIMIKTQNKFLISQALRQFFIQEGAYGMNWSEIMLASTVVIIPVILIFIIGQKWFLSGIAQDSGIK